VNFFFFTITFIEIYFRWYRAPEVILGKGQHSIEQDVWAAGCTFFELLFRMPLFPGTSSIQQLKQMISILGTPETMESDFQMCSNARTYLQALPASKGTGLDSFFNSNAKHTDAEVMFKDNFVVLLADMLMFNPNMRVSSIDSLSYSFFQPFTHGKFKIDFDDQSFDFRDIENCQISEYPQNMWKLLTYEINLIHSDSVSDFIPSCSLCLKDIITHNESLLLSDMEASGEWFRNVPDEIEIDISDSPLSSQKTDSECDDEDSYKQNPLDSEELKDKHNTNSITVGEDCRKKKDLIFKYPHSSFF
jgi:hypothetical protein